MRMQVGELLRHASPQLETLCLCGCPDVSAAEVEALRVRFRGCTFTGASCGLSDCTDDLRSFSGFLLNRFPSVTDGTTLLLWHALV